MGTIDLVPFCFKNSILSTKLKQINIYNEENNIELDLDMIVIVRHGVAQNLYDLDLYRELTDVGRADIQKRADYLKEQGIEFDEAFVSPYIRTLQTFEIIKDSVVVKDSNITRELEPNGNVQIADYFRLLHDDHKNILVISHMPLVSFLMKELCGIQVSGFMNPGDMNILDQKGDNELFKVIYTTNFYDLNV